MAAKLTGGTAAAGVVAYQDHQDPQQFHYFPANSPCVPGQTLQEYSVKYWGIGPEFLVDDGSGIIKSQVGAVISGRAAIDITSSQRARLEAAILTAYGVSSPKLIPLLLENVTVQPIVGGDTLMLGEGSKVDFPSTVALGTTFNFAVGSGNSLFASFVGAQAQGNQFTPDPSFGVNIYGDATFQGNPWTVTVTADLSQVWSYTRRRFNAGINFGWINLSLADYQQTILDMQRDSIITLTFEEGTADYEQYGRQLFEMGKEMLEAVNAMTNAGEGFFKFEPNPTPPTSEAPLTGFAWPWQIRLNGGYGENAISSTQKMHWEKRITYSGQVTRRMPASMTLAVKCNDATAGQFSDLADPGVPCITKAKADALQERLKKERKAKAKLLKKLYEKYILGDLTEEEYYAKVALVNQFSATEDSYWLPAGTHRIGVGEATHEFRGRQMVRGLTEADIDRLFHEGKS